MKKIIVSAIAVSIVTINTAGAGNQFTGSETGIIAQSTIHQNADANHPVQQRSASQLGTERSLITDEFGTVGIGQTDAEFGFNSSQGVEAAREAAVPSRYSNTILENRGR